MVMLNPIVAAVRGAREFAGSPGTSPEVAIDLAMRFGDEMTHMTGCESSNMSAFRRRRM
jgi:hypothetical protein